MRSWTVVICLVVTQLAELGCGKRFDPAMVDPLMRRSSLDKNFMRFGRSSPSYDEKDETEESLGEDNKEEFLRFMRGKDNNFMRFGRGKNDNFMRFGRGKQDSFMRFGRARNDNYMRFGRGRDSNFMRFGRGKQANFMRFGRGKEDNYMRFGRGKQDNFMRFGKGVNYGKQDSFMRLGRGKQDSFMRFGRDYVLLDNLKPDLAVESNADEAARIARGRQNNLMRFGKKDDEDYKNEIVEISEDPKQNLRIVRGKQDSFMRFGKSGDKKDSVEINDEAEDKDSENNLATLSIDFPGDIKPKDFDLVRLNRNPLGAHNGFIRYGRSSQNQGENFQELIPQRLKRSLEPGEVDRHDVSRVAVEDVEEEFAAPVHQEDYTSRKKRSLANYVTTPAPISDDSSDEVYIYSRFRPQLYHIPPRVGRSSGTRVENFQELISQRLKRSLDPEEMDRQDVSRVSVRLDLPGDLEEEYVAPHQEDFYSRKKRSPGHYTTPPTVADDSVVDYISAKLRLRSSPPQYESSLLSAGLPNVIVGPEFSLLPDLDPPTSMLKRSRPGDKSFLRLG